MNRERIKQLALSAGIQLVPQGNCTFDLPESVYRFVDLLVQESSISDFAHADSLIAELGRYQRHKADGECLCPGCDVHITPDNAGGYRTYCDKCVSVFPSFPAGAGGFQMTGRYPSFQWVSVGSKP